MRRLGALWYRACVVQIKTRKNARARTHAHAHTHTHTRTHAIADKCAIGYTRRIRTQTHYAFQAWVDVELGRVWTRTFGTKTFRMYYKYSKLLNLRIKLAPSDSNLTKILHCAIITKYGSTLYIGMDKVLSHYACTL